MSVKTDDYIAKRKRKAQRLSFLFRVMRVFPIRKNKIVFAAFEGDGGFGCNPKYIAEELHKRGKEYEMVWLTHHSAESFPSYIKVVKDTPFSTAFHLSTAKVWVDNYRKPFGTLKRKGQLYIQTWHATIGFKAVGLFRGAAFPEIARIVSEWDSNLIDYVLSNSEYCDKVYPKKLLYSGPTLRVGSPRVDPLINCKEELHRAIRDKLGLDQTVKLLLYAPTFRGGTQKGKKEVEAEIPNLDFQALIDTLQQKDQSEWHILLRLHPQLAAKMEKMPLLSENPRLHDVSQDPDISAVMGGCDFVITDYSSCAFDAAFANIPVIIYADDIKNYAKDRGGFMWKREELPFLITEDNEELGELVRSFDQEEYLEMVRAFMETHQVVEDGKASVHVADLIEKNVKKDIL